MQQGITNFKTVTPGELLGSRRPSPDTFGPLARAHNNAFNSALDVLAHGILGEMQGNDGRYQLTCVTETRLDVYLREDGMPEPRQGLYDRHYSMAPDRTVMIRDGPHRKWLEERFRVDRLGDLHREILEASDPMTVERRSFIYVRTTGYVSMKEKQSASFVYRDLDPFHGRVNLRHRPWKELLFHTPSGLGYLARGFVSHYNRLLQRAMEGDGPPNAAMSPIFCDALGNIGFRLNAPNGTGIFYRNQYPRIQGLQQYLLGGNKDEEPLRSGNTGTIRSSISMAQDGTLEAQEYAFDEPRRFLGEHTIP